MKSVEPAGVFLAVELGLQLEGNAGRAGVDGQRIGAVLIGIADDVAELKGLAHGRGRTVSDGLRIGLETVFVMTPVI